MVAVTEGRLRLQYLPPRQHPLHLWPHAQLVGDGQKLVQQGRGLFSVAWLVSLKECRKLGVFLAKRTPALVSYGYGEPGQRPMSSTWFLNRAS